MYRLSIAYPQVIYSQDAVKEQVSFFTGICCLCNTRKTESDRLAITCKLTGTNKLSFHINYTDSEFLQQQIMNLLYVAIGEDINTHSQVHFSICSFLTQDKKISTINVITDYPDFYNDFKNKINIIYVNEKLLTEWKGNYNYFFRIKIKAVEMLCNLYKNEPVLYLDADTFLYGNIEPLRKIILQDTALMHQNEGKIAAIEGKTVRRLWTKVRNNTYSGISIDSSHSMWNSGVIGIPNKHNAKECVLALSICDEMFSQGIKAWMIEQFAFAIALDEIYGLKPADSFIAHYWSNKNEWNKLIEHFFLSAQFKAITVDQIVESIKKFDFSKAAVRIKLSDTNARLKSLIEKIYAAKKLAVVNNNLLPQ